MNKTTPPSAIFFGTPSMATVIFEHLLSKKIVDIKTVVTNPDKPAGRGNIITTPPVKILAQKNNIEVLQPKSASDPELRDTIQYLSPDLIIVVAYGHILPSDILQSAKKGSLNVHPSLLPKYRGANPIASAIDAGEKQTGITIMLMDDKMDHGPIISQTATPIKKTETTEQLTERLAKKGAILLAKIIPAWINNEIKPKKQNHAEATYTKLMTKQDGQIDWSEPAEIIERHIRAFHPWPGAWSILSNNKRIKILSAKARRPRSIVDEGIEEGALQLYNKMPVIRTGNGVLELKKIQLEGKQPMSGQEFLNGYQSLIGKRLL